jgi:hypothetical protein
MIKNELIDPSTVKRKCCGECPWKNDSQHNKSWPNYVIKMVEVGKLNNGQHCCHMITKETWNQPTSENVCVGSLNR